MSTSDDVTYHVKTDNVHDLVFFRVILSRSVLLSLSNQSMANVYHVARIIKVGFKDLSFWSDNSYITNQLLAVSSLVDTYVTDNTTNIIHNSTHNCTYSVTSMTVRTNRFERHDAMHIFLGIIVTNQTLR